MIKTKKEPLTELNKKGTLDRINKTSTSRFFFFLIEKRQGLVVLIYNPFILGTSAIVIIQISITLKRWYIGFSVHASFLLYEGGPYNCGIRPHVKGKIHASKIPYIF